MVYTGTKKNVPKTIHLSDLCGEKGSVEVKVTVLWGDDSSIVGQYVDFCQIADEQRKIHGYTRTAIQETMRICQEPLGRAGDLLAAIADKTKLTSLAQEFGLKM